MFEFSRLLVTQLAASLWLVLASSALHAATFQTKPLNDTTVLVFVEGDLEFGDEKKFASVAIALDDAVVVFKSRGGNLKAGIDIGKAVRLKGFVTYVPDGQFCALRALLRGLAGALA